MELNWSTFLLEIINFLVLVWILKRFLYRPVLSILDKRREKIEQSLREASDRQAQAIKLEQQYKKRLDDWALEKQQLMETLQQEIQTERTQRLERLKSELDAEREKTTVFEQRQQAETLSRYQHEAHRQAARFASRILNAVASKELESRLFVFFISSLEKLDKAHGELILHANKNSSEVISVTSAFQLSDEQQQQLEQKLETLCKQLVKVEYKLDPQLVAGLRVLIGSSVLGINLQDELNSFVELTSES